MTRKSAALAATTFAAVSYLTAGPARAEPNPACAPEMEWLCSCLTANIVVCIDDRVPLAPWMCEPPYNLPPHMCSSEEGS